jgi:uncharacterized protein (UPF0218 family)
MRIPETVKNELKKPLGKFTDIKKLKWFGKKRKIISVGDVCTLNLISAGITPHLAIFDFIYMRQELENDRRELLRRKFAKPKKYKNPPGTLSKKLILDAKKLVKKGGGVLIDGEEDLTALAFILAADEEYLVVYGQPHKGMVMVIPEKEIKRKIKNWLTAAAFCHEVKGDKGKN